MIRKKIYFIEESGTGAIKIGLTGDIKKRKSGIKSSTPHQLRVLGVMMGDIQDEAELHKKFSQYNIQGEWYRPEPELLAFIKTICQQQHAWNAPLNLEKAAIEFENISPTPGGEECKKWLEIAQNLPSVVEEADKLLSIEEAARLLGISSQTLRNWESEGRIVPQHTKKGHRRYTKKQIYAIRKQQMNQKELLLHGITARILIDGLQKLLDVFKPDEIINLTITHDYVLGKVKITVDAEDGSTTSKKIFNIKE